MSPEAAEKLDRFFHGLGRSRRPLLLLDYDGTLAPFQADRFQATPWPGVRQLLHHILQKTRTRIAVVTGRPAADVAPLLGLDAPIEVWGLHGFERIGLDGVHERQQLPRPVEENLAGLRAQLRRDSFGGHFEDKPNAAVMHWRGLSPEDAARIEQRTRALFEPLTQIAGFSLLPFDAGLELRAGRDKGGAVEMLLAGKGEGESAAYLGDDLTDEAAFAAMKGRGLSVLVRPEWRRTAADVWLRPPEGLLEFLKRWLQESMAQPAAGNCMP